MVIYNCLPRCVTDIAIWTLTMKSTIYHRRWRGEKKNKQPSVLEKAVPVPVHNSPTCLQSQRLSVLPLQTPPETRPSSPSPPPPPPAQLGASREVCSSPPLNSSPSRRPALLLPREKKLRGSERTVCAPQGCGGRCPGLGSEGGGV
ncbi:Nesprin-2 [Manis javanica]|nr:Nesprin-2 [Manis javanica]